MVCCSVDWLQFHRSTSSNLKNKIYEKNMQAEVKFGDSDLTGNMTNL